MRYLLTSVNVLLVLLKPLNNFTRETFFVIVIRVPRYYVADSIKYWLFYKVLTSILPIMFVQHFMPKHHFFAFQTDRLKKKLNKRSKILMKIEKNLVTATSNMCY